MQGKTHKQALVREHEQVIVKQMYGYDLSSAHKPYGMLGRALQLLLVPPLHRWKGNDNCKVVSKLCLAKQVNYSRIHTFILWGVLLTENIAFSVHQKES